jgi:hypothetical protein
MVGGSGGVADALFTELDRSRFEDNFLDKKEELEGFAETGISNSFSEISGELAVEESGVLM